MREYLLTHRHPDTKTKDNKENCGPISPMNADAKTPQQRISRPNPETYKKEYTSWLNGILSKKGIYIMTEWDFIPDMQVWLNVQKSSNVLCHMNRIKHIFIDLLNRCKKGIWQFKS